MDEVKEQSLREKYLDLVNQERNLKAEKLRAHILNKHPKIFDDDLDDFENWSMLQDVGALCGDLCCSRKIIMRFTKNVGIGPSLFLLVLKAYIRLFIVLSFLCIPSCVVLSSGKYIDTQVIGTSGAMYSSDGFMQYLSKRTLGNIGPRTSYGCGYADLA